MEPYTVSNKPQETENKEVISSLKSFPIVGVGASAGGLEAFTQLLEALPEKIGMAYVLVQHLDPHHESSLAKILAKSTSIPVIEATHNLEVSPDHIYIIPPNASMTIVSGRLHLVSRKAAAVPFLPIDLFLNSLAEERKEYAIGIILSGNGTDGTLGLEKIKAAGGITFAQEEKSCKFCSMPESAIRTGCVDFILTPQEMGSELTRIGQHPHMLQTSEPDPLNVESDDYRTILTILRTALGVDFNAYRDTTIKRRIMRRMVLHPQEEGIKGYISLLKNDPNEVKALYQDFLINVTNFFREPEVFEILKNKVFSELISKKNSDTPLRIWVPGCSTGQEVYSLLIVLLEYFSEKNLHIPVQIFGTDLSEERSLVNARAGLYPKNIEAEVSPERLKRFFTKTDGKYQINKSLREMCIFAKHNVTSDPPFSRMDLISCRNLLIYLALPLQRRVIPTFHYALNPKGVLVLGAAETVGQFTDLFGVIDQKLRIYCRKADTLREYPHFNVKNLKLTSPLPANIPATTSVDWKHETDRILSSKYAPAGVLVNENFDILQFRGKTTPYLEPPAGEPSHNLSRMACEGLFPALRRAIEECRQSNKPVRTSAIQIRRNKQMQEINIEVLPIKLQASDATYFLVLFEDANIPAKAPDTEPMPEHDEVMQLRQELISMNEYLQSIVEQKDAINEELRAANEESLSSNEELQSTNEELETAKEELQSINEELTTVNEQLTHRNRELGNLNIRLLEARDYAEAIVETVREPLIVLNGHLQVQTANQAFYTMFHTTPNSTENRFFYSLQNNAWDIPRLRILLEEILPKQKRLENYKMEHTFQTLGYRVMLLNARRLVSEDNQEPLILLAIEDITINTKLETELRETSKKLSTMDMHKNEFLATLAHELRNPLAPISNALELVELPRVTPEMKTEAHAIMKRQLKHMVRLVDDLLDLSRISNGKIELRKKPVRLTKVMETAIEISKPLIESSGHELIVELPKEALWLEMDSTRLIQSLGNLLNNAAKYTPQGGRIWFRAEREKNEVAIHVKDNGIGIAAEKLPYIFDIFSQIDNSIERSQGGLGIGLSLAKNLIKLHGGTLTVQSEGLGKGAEFTTRLPLTSTPDKDKKFKKKKSSTNKKTSKNILVVDDNESSAKTLGWMLETLGCDVTVVHNASSALLKAKSLSPDLVLMDIGMPKMDGYKVCQEIRKEPGLKHTMIVAQSGWGQEEQKEKARNAGFDHYLVKPVSFKTIKDILDNFSAQNDNSLVKVFYR